MATVYLSACTVAPNIGTDVYGASCPAANRVVVETTSEFLQQTQVASPFVLPVADGVQLSLLIIGVWVTAFVIRMWVRTLSTSTDRYS